MTGGRTGCAILVLAALALSPRAGLGAGSVLSPDDVLKLKRAVNVTISPDGRWAAYAVRTMRPPGDEAGGPYRELWLVPTGGGEARPFVTGKETVYSPAWSPDGRYIAYRAKRGGDKHTQVWVIPTDGGESFRLTRSQTSVLAFVWLPEGRRIAYVATTPPSSTERRLKDSGYGLVVHGENLKSRNVYIIDVASDEPDAEQLTHDMSVWQLAAGPDGNTLAVGASPLNLVDQRYVFQKIDLVDIATKEVHRLVDNPGKLGVFSFNPDGSRVAYAAARDKRDHAVSHAYVIDVAGGPPVDVTPPDFRGHIEWVGWRDDKTVVFKAGNDTRTTLNVVKSDGKSPRVILDSGETGVIFGNPSFTGNFRTFAMAGSTPSVPADVYAWTPGQKPRRLTNLNPWLEERALGKQEVLQYKARDGLVLDAIVYYPVDYREGARYPLVVVVHGGPESHYSLGWHTRYSQPCQVLAGEGYVVMLPNYRSSTGYGVDFTRDHLGDAAGKEFDDVADGIDHMIELGIADGDRVGLCGGSYGGYAAAWFSSYYTDKVKAVCMFVGISDLISKRGTTDIPYEELYVHSGKPLEEMWDLSLQRSPIYYAHQSKTAVLILGGANDARVNPAQSLEYYTRLKMNGHPAVRFIQYPGEGHGNTRQPGRIDYLYRTLEWLDWYVMQSKPLDGPMPPLDVSDKYGLDLGGETN